MTSMEDGESPGKCNKKDASLVRAVEDATMATLECQRYTTLWELNFLS